MSSSPPKLYASVLFPELEKELNKNKQYIRNLRGYFIVRVLKGRRPAATWYLVLNGNNQKPVVVCQTKPPKPSASIPTVTFELDDKDLLKLATGGMNGIKAISEKKLKITGDLQVAQQVEELFKKTGGVDRVMSYIKKNYGQEQSKQFVSKL